MIKFETVESGLWDKFIAPEDRVGKHIRATVNGVCGIGKTREAALEDALDRIRRNARADIARAEAEVLIELGGVL